MTNSTHRSHFLALTLGAAALSAVTLNGGSAAGAVDASKFVKRGTLTCDVAAGVGFVVGSSKALTCSFDVKGEKSPHRYSGKISKLGLDVGFTGEGKVIWGVYADPKTKLKGKLAGSYSGLSAEVTAGLGLGAKALVGTQQEIALQPLKLDGQTGLNLAVGIASVTLAIAK